MTRRLPLRAEVKACLYKARAKELLPEAVDRDARRQRVFGRDEPAGQIQPASPLGIALRQRRQERWHIRLHFFPALVVLPPEHDEAVPGFLQVLENERRGDALVERVAILLDGRQFAQRLFELR